MAELFVGDSSAKQIPDCAACQSCWILSNWDNNDRVMQVIKEAVEPPANKYTVRPPKDLRSKYELKMEERRMKQLADEEEELRNAEAERLRVSLVMLLCSSQNVTSYI